MNATLTSPELTRADRCDRCGAAARVARSCRRVPSCCSASITPTSTRQSWSSWPPCWRSARSSPDGRADDRALRRVIGAASVNAGVVMTDQHPPAKPSRHHIWRVTKRTLGQELGRLDLLRVGPGRVLVCAVAAAAAAGHAGQPGVHRAAVRPGHVADHRGPADQHARTASSRPTWSTRSSSRRSATSCRVRAARWCRIGFVISLWAGSSAVSAFVDSIVEAHDQTPLAPSRAPAVLRAGPVRGDAGVRHRRRRRSSRSGRSRSPSTSRTAGTTSCSYGYYPVLFVGLVIALASSTGCHCPGRCRRTGCSTARCWPPRCSWWRRWACGCT